MGILEDAPVVRGVLHLAGVHAADVQGHQDLEQLLGTVPGARVYSNGVQLPNGTFLDADLGAQQIYDPAATGGGIPAPAQKVLDYLDGHGVGVRTLKPQPVPCGNNGCGHEYGLVQALLDLGGTYFNNNSIVMPDGAQFYNGAGDLADTQNYFDVRQALITYNLLPADMPADPRPAKGTGGGGQGGGQGSPGDGSPAPTPGGGAPSPTPTPAPSPAPSPGGSYGYTGPFGRVPIPAPLGGVAIPVGGGQSYLLGSKVRAVLLRLGLLKQA